MSKNKSDNYWIPLADLMTVLMVIFLLISVSYMALIEKKQAAQNALFTDFEDSRIGLHNELEENFKKDMKRWDLQLDSDLSIKFVNPQVLFKLGSAEITPKFKEILDEFIPRYFDVILKPKYKNRVAEVRIEGHTDTLPILNVKDPYIANMKLSQDRARNVLEYIREQDYFKSLNNEQHEQIQYWLTANGLSYSRALDEKFNLVYKSKKKVDIEKSRRVEFRIVTTSEDVIEKVLEKIK